MNYNRIILVGRLTRDPELRATPDGTSVVRFAIAVNRPVRPGAEEQVDYFDIVAFRQLADTVANYTTRGRLVLVEGRLQTRSYTDREGNRRKAYEVVADTVRFLERIREGEPEAGADMPAAAGTAPAPPPPSRTVQRPAAAAPSPAPEPAPMDEPVGDFDDIDFDEGDLDDPFR
ncbi:MAG: single-stranded DNA-binding protein [Armatimonadetes bacterium]|nr:single-stranded DNA-binding protein [Armatimonadota bacterium]